MISALLLDASVTSTKTSSRVQDCTTNVRIQHGYHPAVRLDIRLPQVDVACGVPGSTSCQPSVRRKVTTG